MSLDEGKSREATGRGRDEAIEGKYANHFAVGHNAVEFLLEFGQSYRDREEQLHSRIVTNPMYAKELLRVLSRSIRCYEEQFGEIDSPPEH